MQLIVARVKKLLADGWFGKEIPNYVIYCVININIIINIINVVYYIYIVVYYALYYSDIMSHYRINCNFRRI